MKNNKTMTDNKLTNPTSQPIEPRTQNAAAESVIAPEVGKPLAPYDNGSNGANHDHSVGNKALAIIQGRTPKLTPEMHADILECLRNGMTVGNSCEKVGISRATFYQWRLVNPSFSDTIAEAREAWTHAIVDRGLTELTDCPAESREDMVKVKKSEALAKFSLDLAGRLNPRDYSQKQQVQMDVRSVNISTTSEELKELLNGS